MRDLNCNFVSIWEPGERDVVYDKFFTSTLTPQHSVTRGIEPLANRALLDEQVVNKWLFLLQMSCVFTGDLRYADVGCYCATHLCS